MADMSENEFYELQGNSYRGSRYGNFTGGGTTPQGNVSNAVTENQANKVGTFSDSSSDAPPTPTLQSDETLMETPRTSDLVIGAALPYAGTAIGQTAGSMIGAGSSFGEGLSAGVSGLANKVSGGLLGQSSSSSMAGQVGKNVLVGGQSSSAASNLASQASDVGSFGSGANIGAGVGSGVATFAATLLSGGSFEDAAKSGAATGIGTAIGSAVAGPIGGFVGGFIGGLFCFTAGTPIIMANGSTKAVEDLELGDYVLEGGLVHGVAKALNDELYSYKNTVVSGGHAVFENGKWMRVEDSELSVPFEVTKEYEIVYPIATEHNILITPWFISADIMEVPGSGNTSYSDDELLAILNSSTDRNIVLSEIEREHCQNV